MIEPIVNAKIIDPDTVLKKPEEVVVTKNLDPVSFIEI
jgi:hypothetical protein